jgi:hypothetical protein
MNRITKIAALAATALAVASASASVSVTAAHATPISRANAVRMAKDYLQYQGFSFAWSHS